MQYTKEQRAIANKIDLYDFLLKYHAELFKKEGVRYLRYKNDHSVIIGSGKNGYKDCATDKGGSNIDFLTTYLGYSLVDAILALSGGTISPCKTQKSNTEPFSKSENAKIVIPPPIEGSYKRLYAYLLNRKISKETIQFLIDKKLIYEEKEHHNIVFINKKRDFGEVHGTLSYKSHHGVLTNSANGGFWFFQIGDRNKCKNVYVCEAAIDAISLYELHKMENKLNDNVYVSIAGAGKQEPIDFLKKHYHVIIATDNDEAGQNTRDRNSELEYIIPELKDWNEDLIKKKTTD